MPSGTLIIARKIAKVIDVTRNHWGGFLQYSLFKPTPVVSVGNSLSPDPTPIELPVGIGVS